MSPHLPPRGSLLREPLDRLIQDAGRFVDPDANNRLGAVDMT
jgi:hypothetical protein